MSSLFPFFPAPHLLLSSHRTSVQPPSATSDPAAATVASPPKKAKSHSIWLNPSPASSAALALSASVRAHFRAARPDLALSLYDLARSDGATLDRPAFTALIRHLASSGNLDGALAVFREMKASGVRPGGSAYTVLIDYAGRAKLPHLSMSLFSEMTAAGLLPRPAAHCSLLASLTRSRHARYAFSVYCNMKEEGIDLSISLYNSILAMCADMGLVYEGLAVFGDIVKAPPGCSPDNYTFPLLLTILSSKGRVAEAEAAIAQMEIAGFPPDILVMTSMIQCYGRAGLAEKVVKAFDKVLELGIAPDEQLCGTLLNVMPRIPRERLVMIVGCIERAHGSLGLFVRALVDGRADMVAFAEEAESILLDASMTARMAYCNCLIDLCVSLNSQREACLLLELGVKLRVYEQLQSRTTTQWSLDVRNLSSGAVSTALHVWVNDLIKAMEAEEHLPPVLGIQTSYRKSKYNRGGLATSPEADLKVLGAPFHESSERPGWLVTTRVAVEAWLRSSSFTPPIDGIGFPGS